MPDDQNITSSMGDYLEVIYKNAGYDGGVSVTALSNALGVAKSSVHQAVHRLKDAGLVEQDHYGPVTLTDKGYDCAKYTYECHQVLRSFLIDVLGVSEKVAESEACGIEHVVSPSTMEKLKEHMKSCLGRV